MSKKLKYYGGQGFEGLSELGKYEVRANVDKSFNCLSEAKEYYESLNEEKAIWDVTFMSDLIEAHTY